MVFMLLVVPMLISDTMHQYIFCPLYKQYIHGTVCSLLDEHVIKVAWAMRNEIFKKVRQFNSHLWYVSDGDNSNTHDLHLKVTHLHVYVAVYLVRTCTVGGMWVLNNGYMHAVARKVTDTLARYYVNAMTSHYEALN